MPLPERALVIILNNKGGQITIKECKKLLESYGYDFNIAISWALKKKWIIIRDNLIIANY